MRTIYTISIAIISITFCVIYTPVSAHPRLTSKFHWDDSLKSQISLGDLFLT